MKRLRRFLQVALGGTLTLLADPLYDGSSGTTPEQQGWGFVSLPQPLSPTVNNGAVKLDTLATANELAGYSRLAPVPLDRTNGFRVSFGLQLHQESHNNPNRAGLSVVVLGADQRGLELAFWTDRIWAQNDAPLFTHGEEVSFNSTDALVVYELTFTTNRYTLRANSVELLTGSVRDYTSFVGLLNPYETPNFLFIGDDTTSAKASFSLSRVDLFVSTPAPPRLDFHSPIARNRQLTLSWSPAQKLQHATQLTPANWTDYRPDPESPVTGSESVCTVAPMEYFRTIAATKSITP